MRSKENVKIDKEEKIGESILGVRAGPDIPPLLHRDAAELRLPRQWCPRMHTPDADRGLQRAGSWRRRRKWT